MEIDAPPTPIRQRKFFGQHLRYKEWHRSTAWREALGHGATCRGQVMPRWIGQSRRVARPLMAVTEFICWLVWVHPQPPKTSSFWCPSSPKWRKIKHFPLSSNSLYLFVLALESHLWIIRKPSIGRTLTRLGLADRSKRKKVEWIGKNNNKVFM